MCALSLFQSFRSWRVARAFICLSHYLNACALKIEESSVLWTWEDCEIQGAQDLIYVKKNTSFMPKGKIKAPGTTGLWQRKLWLDIYW